MVSITLVIPCYKPHLQKLLRLLDSVNNQTRLPDNVIISCSSTLPGDLPSFPSYCFNYTLIVSDKRANAAENRNRAARLATTTDYISFIDADDIMHEQRIELICKIIETKGAEFIMHSYHTQDELTIPFEKYENVQFDIGKLYKAPSLCAAHIDGLHIRLHHSQATVSRRVFELVGGYNENKEAERREDALFCGVCLSQPITNGYIPVPLTKYDYAGYWE